jgi:hypothetical protein
MARLGRGLKMRQLPFIPTISEISAGDARDIPGLEAVVSYWTEGAFSAEDWYEEVSASWGTAGLVMRRGDEVMGFAVYGPHGYLPRAYRYPVGPLGTDTALLAYLEGDSRSRRHLLVRVARDLRLRGYGGVEAISSDLGRSRYVPTRFLLENGWEPVRRGFRLGLPYTLARANFGNTVEIGERARDLMGRVKLPVLGGAPSPVALSPQGPTRARMSRAPEEP